MIQTLDEPLSLPAKAEAKPARDIVNTSRRQSKTSRKWLRLTTQFAISIALLAYLVHLLRLETLKNAWNHAGPQTLLIAFVCFVIGVLISARRWLLLLHWQGINENLHRLIEVYFIGMFCSLFLPTAAGGDIFRVYDVARRKGATARVLLATLQDRLIGLGAIMFVGLVGTIWFSYSLPSMLVAAVVTTYVVGLVVVGITLATKWCSFLSRLGENQSNRRLASIGSFLSTLRDARPLKTSQLVRAAFLALATFVCAVIAQWAVCDAFDADCSPVALCVVVSLVGIVRMLPLSPNGAGVGEGALVYLIGLFGVGESTGAMVALVLLAVQVAVSMIGGVLLLRRMLAGTPLATSVDEDTESAVVPGTLPRTNKDGRHAA